MYQNLATIAIFILVYSCLEGGLKLTWISGAMLFTIFGFVVGPTCLGLLDWELNRDLIRELAEMTLAVMLFTDAVFYFPGNLRQIQMR